MGDAGASAFAVTSGAEAGVTLSLTDIRPASPAALVATTSNAYDPGVVGLPEIWLWPEPRSAKASPAGGDGSTRRVIGVAASLPLNVGRSAL